MTTKDDQQGRVKTGDTGKTGSAEDLKKHFPQAGQANASREAYQQTADERRIAAERAANMDLAAQKASAEDAQRQGDPIPTGESDNPHAEEPAVDPEGNLPKHSDEENARRRAGQHRDHKP